MSTIQSLSFDRRREDQRFTDVTQESSKLLPTLKPIVQSTSSTTSLYEAVHPIHNFVEDLSNRVAYALERCQNPKDGLTNDESAAIFLYTQQWPYGKSSFYTIFNRTLRDKNHVKLVPFHQYVNLIMSAFYKLPSIQTRVWRGGIGDYSSQYQLDTIHVWRGINSCSDMVQVTSDFVDETKKLTLFCIQCMNGKLIKNHSEFPNEDEIVLLPGTYLKVKSFINATHNLCIVYLEEIPQLMIDTAALTKISSASQLVDNVYVLWLDPNITSDENKKTQEKLKELFHNNFIPLEQLEEAIRCMEEKQNEHFLLITGGYIGRQIVPKIHNFSQLYSIVVYCMDKQANEQWSKEYEKVKAVVVIVDEMIQKVQELYEDKKEQQLFSSTDMKDEPEEMSTLIHRIMEQPLLSLEESLHGLTDIILNLQDYISIAMNKCENPVDGLTQNESAAIHIHTMHGKPYEKNTLCHLLNEDLRSESRNALKKWFPYLKLFLHALNKLPSYEGTVYRGVTMNIADQFKIGQTGTWWSISTTTRNMSVLDSPEFLGRSGSRTLFSIECKNGKCVRKHSHFEAEDEVLLFPGFNFEETTSFDAGNGLRIISLKEIVSTLEEIPPLSIDPVVEQDVSIYVLWLDPNINSSQENKDVQEKLKELFHNYFIPFENLEGVVQYMEEKQNQHFLLITGGYIGRQSVPKINHLSQLHFIIVYCMNKEANEEWSKDYEKVKAVIIDANEMIKIVQKLYQDLTATSGNITHLSHPLYGVMDQPLLSLKESLQEITHIIPNLQNYINVTLMNSINPANNLTPNESAAIQIYTMEYEPSESSISYLLNKDLRSESQSALKKWFPYLKLFLHALNKLPSYKGIVWRCVSGDLTHQFLDKQTGIWCTISSTRLNMNFQQSDTLLIDNGMRTLFAIECTNGKRISKHSYFHMADEILLLPAFSYEVTSQLDAGNGLHIIGLREIDSSYKYY